jgi:hypothetical protein
MAARSVVLRRPISAGETGFAAAVDPSTDAREGPVDVVSPELRQADGTQFGLQVAIDRHAVEQDAQRTEGHPSVEPQVEERTDLELRGLHMDAAIQR